MFTVSNRYVTQRRKILINMDYDLYGWIFFLVLFFVPQVSFIQRSHAAQKRKSPRSAHRTRFVCDTRGDQQRLCKKDENLEACAAGGRNAAKRGQASQYCDQTWLEEWHKGDVPKRGRSVERKNTCRYCFHHSRQTASIVQARGQRSEIHGSIDTQTSE